MPMVNGQSVGSFEGSFGRDRNLGLTTGSTIYGNTAFGPAGGRAAGYAMKSGGDTMRPGNANYSNFRTRDGGVMFGNVGDRQFKAPNAGNAFGQARNLNMQLARPPAAPVAAAGGPLPVTGVMGRPAFGPPPAPPFQLQKSMMPGLFGGQAATPSYDYYAALRSAIPPGTMAFGPFNPPAGPYYGANSIDQAWPGKPMSFGAVQGGAGIPGYATNRYEGYGGALSGNSGGPRYSNSFTGIHN